MYLVILSMWWGLFFAPQASPPKELCTLQGAVYIESQAQLADYRLHRLEEPAFADLRVFKQVIERYADQPGHWYITQIRAEADFTVYWERDPLLAQGTVAFTDLKGLAGCD